MTSCTILISHFHSVDFLRACIRQIRKYSHPKINTTTIVIDQSNDDYHFKMCKDLLEEFGNIPDTIVAHTPPLYSGFGIDWVLHNLTIETDYICQLHVDALPISKNWLYLPIKLIEEYNLSFVGQLHFINYDSPTYPPVPFFSMSPTFNVARTETYKEMALEAGFTRFHNRRQSGLTFKNHDWDVWAEEDYKARGSDDDTVAFCWESRYRQTDKVGLAISGFIQSSFGRLIDDIVFHFGSCNEARGVMDKMPELYQEYTKRINEDYSDELIEEMISLAKANNPNGIGVLARNFWDGKLKKHSVPTDELNKRIEELKNEI